MNLKISLNVDIQRKINIFCLSINWQLKQELPKLYMNNSHRLVKCVYVNTFNTHRSLLNTLSIPTISLIF